MSNEPIEAVGRKTTSNPVDYIKKYREKFNGNVNFNEIMNCIFKGGENGAAAITAYGNNPPNSVFNA
ncbi:MAG: hypothetical protein ACLSWI_07350 [Candidatus Gastranaerophilaceae bacterium]